MMPLSEAVRRLRKGRGWKQQELARRSGIAQGMISSIERGLRENPTQDTLSRLAGAFEMSLPALLHEAGLELPTLPSLGAIPPSFARVIDRHGQHLSPRQWELAASFFEWLAAQGPQEQAAYGYAAPDRKDDQDKEEAKHESSLQ